MSIVFHYGWKITLFNAMKLFKKYFDNTYPFDNDVLKNKYIDDENEYIRNIIISNDQFKLATMFLEKIKNIDKNDKNIKLWITTCYTMDYLSPSNDMITNIDTYYVCISIPIIKYNVVFLLL